MAGWLIGVAIFFPFFALGGMGGGDVKLVGAIGACLGPMGALHVALGAAVAGGVVAVLVTLRSGYFGTCVANVGRLIGFWRDARTDADARSDAVFGLGTASRLRRADPDRHSGGSMVWLTRRLRAARSGRPSRRRARRRTGRIRAHHAAAPGPDRGNRRFRVDVSGLRSGDQRRARGRASAGAARLHHRRRAGPRRGLSERLGPDRYGDHRGHGRRPFRAAAAGRRQRSAIRSAWPTFIRLRCSARSSASSAARMPAPSR